MIKRLFRLFWQREIITYLIAGVLATLVNLLVFMLLSQVFGPERWYLTNAPAISASLLFAFFTNRWFVFRSKGPVWLEFRRFVGSRILISLLFEYGAMYLLFNVMGIQLEIPIGSLSLSVSKVLTQFLVVAGNYVMSKLFIFRHQSQNQADSGQHSGQDS